MDREHRLIPTEIKVHVQLPPEASALLRDLHADRQSIGVGSAIILACTIAMTIKAVFVRSEAK